MNTDETNITSVLNLDVDLFSKNPEGSLLKNLRTVGCAVLKNHNVPISLIYKVFNDWEPFFSSKEKSNWTRLEETDEGFIPIHGERARKDIIADFKELYQAHYHRPFPEIVNSESTTQLFDNLVILGNKIIHMLDKSLPFVIKRNMSGSLSEMISDSNNHLLRIIHYPPVENKIDSPRAAAHTDICLITIVSGANFKGLEFQNRNGEWYEPKVDQSDMIVFASDMIDLATNGYIQTVPHRVKAKANGYTEKRYSIPLGFHPKRKALLNGQLTAGDALKNRLNEMGYRGDLLNLTDY